MLEHLLEDDGERVGLFAGRAARDPCPKNGAVRHRADEAGQHIDAELIPGVGITKEARHADEQLLEKEVCLGGIVPQVLRVLAHVPQLVKPHSPLDTPMDGASLVEREVVAGRRAEETDDDVERPLIDAVCSHAAGR